MKIKIQQYLFGGELFSWAIVGQSIGRELINLGHKVDFVSTDGINPKYVPQDLAQHLKKEPDGIYDAQISYTMPHNFPKYLSSGSKNRFGIYNYDGAIFPPQFVKYCVDYCDAVLPSSNFSAQIMKEAKIPTNKIITIPHGVNPSEFNSQTVYCLNTKKKYKILLNIASPHLRKNLRNTLTAFGKAFTNNDNVCLVVKVNKEEYQSQKKQRNRFLVNFDDEIKRFRDSFPKAAQVIVISGYLKNLASLYNACDIVFGLSHMEMWWLPGLEGFVKNKLVISSRYGGQLHYLNDQNSLLVDGKIIRMPQHYQYFNPNLQATMFNADIDDAVTKLRQAVFCYDELISKFKPNMEKTIKELTWRNIANQILGLCK